MQIPKWLIVSFVVVSFIGFLDATYLAVSHYGGASLNCSFLNGCDVVTTSKYSAIFGIPVSLLGAIYYLAILVLAIAYLDSRKSGLLKMAARFTVVGLVASVWFVLLQVLVLKAFCLYCIGSAVTSTALFVLGLVVLKLK
ncbi:MAG: vitamin K epoxide reductase family protein, partial [Candidatus Paceibacterota bacterium]